MNVHQLNELLAQVAGVVIQVYKNILTQEVSWTIFGEKDLLKWNPLGAGGLGPAQLNLVKAALGKRGFDIFFHWEHATQLWFAQVRRDDGSVSYEDLEWSRHESEAMALALAILESSERWNIFRKEDAL